MFDTEPGNSGEKNLAMSITSPGSRMSQKPPSNRAPHLSP